MTSAPFARTAGPGSGPDGAPSAIALSPILSARYRSRDLERIRAAAPGARIVTVSVEGLADGPVDDVEVMLRGWVAVDPTFGQFPADAAHLRFINGGLARQTELIKLVGNLKIQILETR